MNHKLEVSIFNQKFEISSSRLTEEELKLLASFVDEQMKETFRITNLSSALKIAVLTALNLAEDVVLKKNKIDTNTSTDNLLIAEHIIKVSQTIDKLSIILEDIEHE